MTPYFDLSEIIRNLNELMRRIQSDAGNAVELGEPTGKWNVQQIDEPNVKGYIIQGHFQSDQPLKPFNPFEPPDPWRRRPMPQRQYSIPNSVEETREPLTDVFEQDDAVKIYVELHDEDKDRIQLNVLEGKVEVKAEKHYKIIDVPANVDIEKATSKYNNGVLTVTIPKKEKPRKEGTRTIKIE